ncbi:MAG TPA: hypothetical protein VIC84_04880 [Blastocatellia bacterium]|jgi:hypothetical protein
MTNLNQAIETAAKKAAGTVWAKSVAKAAAALVNGELLVTVLAGNGNGVVSSPRGTYTIKNNRCSCPATVNHCYHVSALRVVELADEIPVAPAVETRETLVAEIRSTFAAKYPGYRLDETVQRLVGAHHIQWLGVAPLRHILSAIA